MKSFKVCMVFSLYSNIFGMFGTLPLSVLWALDEIFLIYVVGVSLLCVIVNVIVLLKLVPNLFLKLSYSTDY